MSCHGGPSNPGCSGGVGDSHGVQRCVGERDRLCQTLPHALRADAGRQLLPQLRLRLDGQDLHARGEQGAGELPRARGQVEDGGMRSQGEFGGDRADDGRGILGPAPLVDVGNRGEMLCERVQRHSEPSVLAAPGSVG